MTTKSPQAATGKKYFTAASANKMLPLVRSIVADVTERFKEVAVLRERQAVLGRTRRDAIPAAHREEVEQVDRECDRKQDELQDLMHELNELGVELKGPEGLVDFPAQIHGREVCLCWKYGEPEVMFWHECKDGFAGRQPLDTAPSLRG
jgi:hypothetical protein